MDPGSQDPGFLRSWMGNFRIHAKTRIKIVFCVSIPYINHVQTVTLIKKKGGNVIEKKNVIKIQRTALYLH